MTKVAELRQLADSDLATKLTEARKELFNLRFQLATGRLDNIARIPRHKRLGRIPRPQPGEIVLQFENKIDIRKP